VYVVDVGFVVPFVTLICKYNSLSLAGIPTLRRARELKTDALFAVDSETVITPSSTTKF